MSGNNRRYKNVSIFSIADMGDEALGLKLIVECIHASFIGVLHQQIHDCNRIYLWLEQARSLETGSKLIGLIKINHHDVQNIQIVGVDNKARKLLLSELQSSIAHPLLMKRVVPIECADDNSPDIFISFEDFIEDLQSHIAFEDLESPNCILVDSFQDNFDNALTCIKKESIIGLCYKGNNMGRLGNLAWLGIATRQTLFLIDIAKLKMEVCLKNGLKEILTNEQQCKVIDDSRHLQDYLVYQHDNCSLKNVFDVKASDIYLSMITDQKDVPCFLPSLDLLLNNYLGHHFDLLQKYLIPVEDETMWFERPLLNSLTNHLMYSVMFLRGLKQKIISAILADNTKVTSVFQNSLATKGISLFNQLDTSIVPYELRNFEIVNHDQTKIAYVRNKRSNRRRAV